MSDLDFFVFCWWFCAIGFAALLVAFARRRREDDIAAGSSVGDLGTAQNAASASSGKIAGLAILAAFAFLFIGLYVLFWNSHKTNMLMWNFWIIIFLGSILFIPFAWFVPIKPLSSSETSGGTGLLFALIGFGAAAASVYVLVGDWAFQRQIVIGRFDGVEVDNDFWEGPSFYAVIDGKKWRATREGLFGSQTGAQVRAERGVGSKMILRTDLVRPR